MSAVMYIGDAIETMNKLPAGSVDLVLSSPPFWKLRSYLPGDHEDKAWEGGSEETPGQFIDWLIDVAEAAARVLAPHGSMAIELGDTYSSGDNGGPRAKSLTLIPEMFRFALVYGFNPLSGRETDPWILRNVVRWVRPNPPVGALGDKFRPATSELMVFCKSAKRYFDLDAVREPSVNPIGVGVRPTQARVNGNDINDHRDQLGPFTREMQAAGAPPLDWWEIPPGGYSGTVTTKVKIAVEPSTYDGFSGDIQCTRSADCPVHGDRPDPEPTAPHDERATTSQIRSPGTYDYLARLQSDDYVPTDRLLALDFEDASSDSPDPPSIPVATPRSKASNRTGPAPDSTTPGTSSGRTRRRIDDIPAGPLSDGPHPDTPGNSISEPSRPSADPGTTPHIDGSSSPASSCTCSYWVEKSQDTSHYAVFPLELCVKPVKAMSPEKVCRVCGEPSRRIVERNYEGEYTAAGNVIGGNGRGRSRTGPGADRPYAGDTTGFSDCGHDSWRPGLILDCFGGSGTVAAVATGHGRNCVLIDLDERNFDLALGRVGPWFLNGPYRLDALPEGQLPPGWPDDAQSPADVLPDVPPAI